MERDIHKNLIYDMNFQTAILEACDWDEKKMNQVLVTLTGYLNVCTKSDLDLVKADLDLLFSENIIEVIITYIKSNLNLLGDNNEVWSVFEKTKNEFRKINRG